MRKKKIPAVLTTAGIPKIVSVNINLDYTRNHQKSKALIFVELVVMGYVSC